MRYVPCHQSPLEVESLLREAVPNLDSILDRTQTKKVLPFIMGTFESGLPSFKADPAIHAHLRNAFRTIIAITATRTPDIRGPILARIVDSYTSCQVIQAQTIDQIFGMLTGRDQGLREQLLNLVDKQKQVTLDQRVLTAFPTINAGVEGPHVQNRVLVDIGPAIGLPGVARAKLDAMLPKSPLGAEHVRSFTSLFKRLFSMEAVIDEFISDINAQDDVPRHISQETLGKWAQDNHGQNFNAHVIYFDSEKASTYEGGPRDELAPFLNRDTALTIAEKVFGVV